MSPLTNADGPDLLDFLAAEEAPAVLHCIMPNMSIACGEDLLAVFRQQRADRQRRTTTTTRETTCPACLARGDLREISRAMTSRQAPEKG